MVRGVWGANSYARAEPYGLGPPHPHAETVSLPRVARNNVKSSRILRAGTEIQVVDLSRRIMFPAGV